MKRFYFRLSTVERLRKEDEQRALQAVGVARGSLERAKNHKQNLQIAKNQALYRKERLGIKVARVHEFHIEETFIRGQEIRIENAERAIQKAMRELEKAIRAYQVSRRKLLQIEKLHTQARQSYERELKRQEAKELRDLMVMRAAWFGSKSLEDLENPEEAA